MKKSDVLKQERASKMAELDSLIKTRKAENRDFTEEEVKRFDTLEAEVTALDEKIVREEKIENAEKRAAEMAAASGQAAVPGAGEEAEKQKVKKRASITDAIKRSMNGRQLEGAEKEMHEIGVQEAREAEVRLAENTAFAIPMSFLRATAQTVSEDSGSYGSALVVDQTPRVQMGFSPASILDSLGVTRMRNLSGGDIPLPVVNDYSFSWLAETGTITQQKNTISGPTLSPNRLGAAVEISNRLLVQSSADVEALVRAKIVQGYENAVNVAAINGSGSSNQPEGVLNNASIGSGSSTNADVPTKALVAELVKLVMEADSTMDSLAFLGSPATKYLLETTLLDSGSGKYLMEKMNELLGYRFFASTHVPQLSSNEVLIFGNWSELFVGEWGPLSVVNDPYGAALSNSVRLILNGHADVAIAQPGAFAANTYFNATDASS